MGRNRSMTPGGTGSIYGANTVGNQGGGNKKQGLPPTIGRAGWLSNFISTNSGSSNRGPVAAGSVDLCPKNEKTGVQTVSTQEQAELLRGVTKIIGDLNITDDVTDLSPFDCLKEITGSFNIDNGILTSISGFGRLETVGGDFKIYDNGQLTSISGFGRLETVGGDFGIFNNNTLPSISGFGSLKTIHVGFAIYRNGKLTEISGFGKLKTAKRFEIWTNANLIKISGFDSLETIETDTADPPTILVPGRFTLYNNPALVTIPTFNNLKTVKSRFAIKDNTKLPKEQFLAAFNNLESIWGNIQVFSNDNNTTWTLPTGWTDATKLKWGAAAPPRELNDKEETVEQLDTNNFGGDVIPSNVPTSQAGILFTLPTYP